MLKKFSNAVMQRAVRFLIADRFDSKDIRSSICLIEEVESRVLMSAAPMFHLGTALGAPIVNVQMNDLPSPPSTPLIGTFSDSPTSVVSGNATTLTAGNVTDTGGTITGVNFYRESNGTSGLQIGDDTLVGAGTQSGTSWSISASSTGLSAGSYTYYAVAIDSNNISTAASSASLTVATPSPAIGSFTDGSAAVTPGGFVSLYANNVAENGTGAIAGVLFYRESNGTAGLQNTADSYVGMGVKSGTEWTFAAPTTALTGTQTYYAVAEDTSGIFSTFLSVTASITATGFSNWTSLSPFLAEVPLSIGYVASTSVINFGTTVYTGPLDTTITLDRIRADNGPNRSGDGAAFTNNGSPPLPTNRGNVYEFTINPQTGSAPSFTTSQIAFPGPMRFMIDTDGDVYFTGDHYSTDQNLYIAGAPSLGTVISNPSMTSPGSSVTLVASNVTETISPTANLNATTGSNVPATVTNVQFYLDTNGISGLQTDTDRLLGSGIQNGTTWTLNNVSTTGLNSGAYTIYAVAVDPAGNTSTQSTTLTIGTGAGTPTIGSFVANPATVTTGTSTTLTAGSVAETGGPASINGVNFYLESNSNSGLQIGSDTLIGSGVQSGTSWSIVAPTTGFVAGDYTYYAVATDSNGVSSAVATASLTVNSAGAGTPTIGSFVTVPATVIIGGSTTLTAGSVGETGGTGSITGVNFYRETNSVTGLQIGSDTLVGAGIQNGTSWTLNTATTGFTAGNYTYYAVANDSNAASSATASAILAVNSATTSGAILGWDVSGQTSFGTQGLAPASAVLAVDNSSVLTGTTNNWTSKFDLGSNALDFVNGATAELVTVTNQIKQGYNNSGWNGSGGLFSTAAATDSTHLTMLGSIINNDGAGNVLYGAGALLGLFGGSSPGVNDVLIKDTYFGDTNLDGTIDGSDYTKIDSGYLTHSTGWSNGDFNYDGVIDGSDYTLIDNAFNTQQSQLPTTLVANTGLTRNAGVGTNGTAATNAWGGNNFASTSAAGITGNENVIFGGIISAGYSASLSSIDLFYRRSSSGPVNGYWQYQLNGGAWALIADVTGAFSSSSTAGAAMNTLSLSSIPGLQNMAPGTLVNFRLTPYGGTSTGGTWYVYNQTGNDLVISGTTSVLGR